MCVGFWFMVFYHYYFLVVPGGSFVVVLGFAMFLGRLWLIDGVPWRRFVDGLGK